MDQIGAPSAVQLDIPSFTDSAENTVNHQRI
jgi:hypothetical protein